MLRIPHLACPLAIWLVLSAPSAVLAGPDCKHWPYYSFWKAANADDVVRCLKAGANLEARTTRGFFTGTPLHSATHGTADMVAALLKAGADPNARDEGGNTPLHSALEYGTEDMVAALLKAGADPKARSKNGSTPLYLAYSSKEVAALVKAGADPNAWDKDGWTPLHKAAHAGYGDTVPALLKAGADPKARNGRGERPIDLIKWPIDLTDERNAGFRQLYKASRTRWWWPW